MHHPVRDIQADFEMNRPTIDIKLPREEIIDTDGSTDGWTDGRTDRRRVRQQQVVFSRKKILKSITENCHLCTN